LVLIWGERQLCGKPESVRISLFFDGYRELLAYSFMPKRREICIHRKASAWRMRLAQQIALWPYETVNGPFGFLVPSDIECAKRRKKLKFTVGQMIVNPIGQ
jgi:hypothetical protein